MVTRITIFPKKGTENDITPDRIRVLAYIGSLQIDSPITCNPDNSFSFDVTERSIPNTKERVSDVLKLPKSKIIIKKNPS